MRFNCQNCGAKYQIADEKVAGKTIRMKCRKCQNTIQVRSKPAGDGLEPQHVDPNRSSKPSPKASGAPKRSPARPPVGSLPRKSDPASLPKRPPSPLAPRSDAAGLRPLGGVPRPGGIPRPRRPEPATAELGGNLPPLGPSPRLGSPFGSHVAPKPAPPKTSAHEEEATVVMTRPSQEELAAALAARTRSPVAPAKGKEPQAPPTAEPSPPYDTEEGWFIGIDGEPMGPVNRSFLKQHLLAGRATAESLVWREDIPDWKPLASFPELAELLPTATKNEPAIIPKPLVSAPVALTRRKSDEMGLGADGPTSSSQSSAKSSPGAGAVASGGLHKPSDAVQAKTFAAGASAQEGAAGAKAESKAATPDPPPQDKAPADKAPADKAPADKATSAPATPSPAEAPTSEGEKKRDAKAPVSAASAAAGAAASRSSVSASDTDEDFDPFEEIAGMPRAERRARPRGLHPLALALIAMAAGFGAVAGYVFLMPKSKPAPASTAKAPEPPPAAPKPTVADSSESDSDGDSESDSDGEQEPAAGDEKEKVSTGNSTARTGAPGGRKTTKTGGKKTASKPASTKEKGTSKVAKPCNPALDPLCEPTGGEPAGPKSGGGSEEKRPGLSPQQAQSVVARNKGGVARSCLPLVNKGTAKVYVTISVAPSGAVSGVSAGGNGATPSLIGCVTSRVRRWRFPKAAGPSTISVPFTLIAQ